MRVPLSWLREYVDVDLSPRELADQLTMRGMEVNAIETGGAGWTDVVVGRVLQVDRHPNADTLGLTRVDVGEAGGELEIVCGAQNLEVGQLVPAALVGAVLPGDRRIERSKIRGVVSNGMLCSAIELGLGTDADGIHILGAGDELPIGQPLAEVGGEIVLDVDVKPNRGDALSMVGLAREIAAFTGWIHSGLSSIFHQNHSHRFILILSSWPDLHNSNRFIRSKTSLSNRRTFSRANCPSERSLFLIKPHRSTAKVTADLASLGSNLLFIRPGQFGPLKTRRRRPRSNSSPGGL